MKRRSFVYATLAAAAIGFLLYRVSLNDPEIKVTTSQNASTSAAADGLRCGSDDSKEMRQGSVGDFVGGHEGRYPDAQSALAEYLVESFTDIRADDFAPVTTSDARSARFVMHVGGDPRLFVTVGQLGSGWEVVGFDGCANLLLPAHRR